jgi:hypothetical protein
MVWPDPGGQAMNPILYRYKDTESVIKVMDGYTPGDGWSPLYGSDEVKAATDAALERAAEVCETILDELSFANAYECSNECAAAIRALKDEE